MTEFAAARGDELRHRMDDLRDEMVADAVERIAAETIPAECMITALMAAALRLAHHAGDIPFFLDQCRIALRPKGGA